MTGYRMMGMVGYRMMGMAGYRMMGMVSYRMITDTLIYYSITVEQWFKDTVSVKLLSLEYTYLCFKYYYKFNLIVAKLSKRIVVIEAEKLEMESEVEELRHKWNNIKHKYESNLMDSQNKLAVEDHVNVIQDLRRSEYIASSIYKAP